MAPTVELPPTIPSTDHTTAWFVVLTTVAVNCCGSVKVSAARAGCTVTPTAANALDPRQSWISTKRNANMRMAFIKRPGFRHGEAMWLDCCLCTRDARLLRQAADFIEYK